MLYVAPENELHELTQNNDGMHPHQNKQKSTLPVLVVSATKAKKGKKSTLPQGQKKAKKVPVVSATKAKKGKKSTTKAKKVPCRFLL
jgi:hypothetical protein